MATQGLSCSLEMNQEDNLCPIAWPGLLHESWASPHFSVIIKLLADQSLIGTAGVLKEGKEKADAISARSQPATGLIPGPCLGLPSPLLLLPTGGHRPWSKKDQGWTPKHPLISCMTLSNTFSLSEPQSPQQ